jgi:formylglycine-generating enzyme required for sulfatase activity
MGSFLPRVLALLLLLPAAMSSAAPRPQQITGLPFVHIPAGKYKPLYRAATDIQPLPVDSYMLMARPVTNEEFLAFVRQAPKYRRDRLPKVFAEPGYLSHWDGPEELGAAARPSQPVVRVSWFAARAFCAARGLRLPSEAEWERAAGASRTRADGTGDRQQREAIMEWYAKPSRDLPDVPFGPANYFGVHDLHGVAWEWVEDFNAAAVSTDPREQGESSRDRFCGAGALRAEDATDYAAFMRVAMRSSLQAAYSGAQLTFRCATDIEAIHANQ